MKGTSAAAAEEAPRSMREIIQKKFIDEIIGSASGWKVLVMDNLSTRVISAALTMYDIMEHKVTLVENLMMNRQPFPDMDVIYIALPTVDAARRISADFKDKATARYNNVHLFFIENVGTDVMGIIQSNSLLVSKLKTFKEVYLDFLAVESSVFHFDQANALEKLYGVTPDATFANKLGHKLAHFCILLHEHPCIRFPAHSTACRSMATFLHQTITTYKRNNPAWTCVGEGGNATRERAQILLLDRSFDPLSPLMHEYTYQAMANDLLVVSDGSIITYHTQNNRGVVEEKQAILNENDEFWSELRHAHIAKVIEVIKERMQDIIQNNSGAALAKKGGADMDITSMAAAVKKLPEYTQTMTKLGQHVNIAQQCMDAFGKQSLMPLSRVEQIISTGIDDNYDGSGTAKEVKGAKLFQLVSETLTQQPLEKQQKIRLLAIYYISQRNVPGSQEFLRQVFAVARLTPSDQQVITNFDRILAQSGNTGASSTATQEAAEKKTGVFSSIFGGGKSAQKIAATPEGEYTDTRHICLLKSYAEQLMAGQLSLEKFPSMGPALTTSQKTEAKSVRKFNPASKFGKKENASFVGGRFIIFIAGGASFAELRVIYELMNSQGKEAILGTTNLLAPDNYLVDVGSLHIPPAATGAVGAGAKRENML